MIAECIMEDIALTKTNLKAKYTIKKKQKITKSCAISFLHITRCLRLVNAQNSPKYRVPAYFNSAGMALLYYIPPEAGRIRGFT